MSNDITALTTVGGILYEVDGEIVESINEMFSYEIDPPHITGYRVRFTDVYGAAEHVIPYHAVQRIVIVN